jgi:hypothetical protein
VLKVPHIRHADKGFNLAEVLLAFALVTIALLALLAQSMVMVNSSQKLDDHTVAADVARSITERLAREVLNDQPAGRREEVWLENSVVDPLLSGTETIGGTVYSYRLFVSHVQNAATGSPIGTGPTGDPNAATRLKRIDVTVNWWDSESQDRVGYGDLKVESTRLLRVTHEAP